MKFRPSLETLDGRDLPDSAPLSPPEAPPATTPPEPTSPAPEIMVTLVRPEATEPVTVSLGELMAEIAAAPPAPGTQPPGIDALMLELGLLQVANQALLQEAGNNIRAMATMSKQFDVLQNKIDDLQTKFAAETDPIKKQAILQEIRGLQQQQKALLDAIKVLQNRQVEIALAVLANNARVREIMQQLGFGQVNVSMTETQSLAVEV